MEQSCVCWWIFWINCGWMNLLFLWFEHWGLGLMTGLNLLACSAKNFIKCSLPQPIDPLVEAATVVSLRRGSRIWANIWTRLFLAETSRMPTLKSCYLYPSQAYIKRNNRTVCVYVYRPRKQMRKKREREKSDITSQVFPLSINSPASLMGNLDTLMHSCPWWKSQEGPETWKVNQPRSTRPWKG